MNSILTQFSQFAEEILIIAEFPQEDRNKYTAKLLSLSFDKTFLDISEQLTNEDKKLLKERISQSVDIENVIYALSSTIDPVAYRQALIRDLRQTLVGFIKAGMHEASGERKQQFEKILEQVLQWNPQD